jgi:hypothetical protein
MGLSTAFVYIHQRNALRPAPLQTYPAGLGSVPCEVLLKTATEMPEALHKNVTAWVNTNRALISSLVTVPPFRSCQQFKQFNDKICNKTKDINLSNHNFIFDINSQETPAVIKIAGFPSRISSMVSSLGYDPYKSKWCYRNDIIHRATHRTIPTQQHISRAATQKLLNQLSLSTDFITPLGTYLYHLPDRPESCDDRNYIIVQEKLIGYQPVSSLDERKKRLFFRTVKLEQIYRAIKYANLWDMSEDNLWISADFDKIAYPDGEKPNNEGYGEQAQWKVAILGLDLDKLKFNIRNWYDGGHRKFEAMLRNYAPKRVKAWNSLYINDPEVQKNN